MTVDTGTQTPTTVITPVVKKKQLTWRLTGVYHQLIREKEKEEPDQEASPSAKKWEEEVREMTQEEETTQSLTLKELHDMQKDYSCQPGKQTSAWLLQCRYSGTKSQKLECKEAQHLGSLPKDQEIDREIGKEATILSLWRQL